MPCAPLDRGGPRLAASLLVSALGLAATLGFAPPVSAGTEEFSTFSIEAQEEDDESLIDRFQMRPPREWRDAWEHAPQAIRTSQGCLTSGQWFIENDLKLSSPLGERARFGLGLRQTESDVSTYQYIDFSFRFPTRYGTPGAMFRPLHDKSRQDFAITWDVGADTTAFQLQAVFGFEDVFNNLWAWRQTRVGNGSEPYEKRPYEPALRIVRRHPRWRLEISGKYLTPSRKRVSGPDYDPAEREASLWGAHGDASFELYGFGADWEVRTLNQQAASSERFDDPALGDDRNFRRMWSVEGSARKRLLPRLTAEGRYLYQERTQCYGAPTGPGRFEAVDRMIALDTAYDFSPRFRAHLGGIYNRATVAETGHTMRLSYGTRNESRAYLGLTARFGRVLVHAVEGFELDPEPYEIWGLHDKGFLSLQTAF